MKSLAKAENTSRNLQEMLSFRIKSLSGLDKVVETRDSDGWPILTVSNAAGTVTAGAKCLLIKIKGVDMVSKDIFGNADTAFTPHIIEVAQEEDALTSSEFATMFLEIAKIGMRIQLKTSAALAAASFATAVSADLDDILYPTKTA